jgi:hypothetical protein
VEASLKILRTVRLAMLGSIVIYAWIGERSGPPPRTGNAVVAYYAITALAISMVGAIFVLRRIIVLPAENALANNPEDTTALNRWRAGSVVTHAICEALALYGLVLRFMGFRFSQVLIFYVAGFALMLFFAPRRPSNAIG